MLTALENISDEDLLEKIQGGSHQAFNTLVNRNLSKFYSIAFRVVNDKEAAEDIVQDAFIKLWEDPWKWNPNKNTKFTTWFYRIVSNLAFDFKRKKTIGQLPPNQELMQSDNNLDEQIDRDSISKQINKLIEELPERQQLALNLSYYEDLKIQEISDIMEISYKAAESLVGRAKKALKDKIKERRINYEHK